MMETWADQVIEKWSKEGVKINIGAPLASIESAEKILNFNFPEHFKELYFKMDGFKDLDW
jgi:cell wall assembly regulator SMI1